MGPKKKAGIFSFKTRPWCWRWCIKGWVPVKQGQSLATADHMVTRESRPFEDIIETNARINCKTWSGV